MKSKNEKSNSNNVCLMLVVALCCFSCMLPGELEKQPEEKQPSDCHVLKLVYECSVNTWNTMGACAAMSDKDVRLTVLRPAIIGDTVCHYRRGFYRVLGQPLVY